MSCMLESYKTCRRLIGNKMYFRSEELVFIVLCTAFKGTKDCDIRPQLSVTYIFQRHFLMCIYQTTVKVHEAKTGRTTKRSR